MIRAKCAAKAKRRFVLRTDSHLQRQVTLSVTFGDVMGHIVTLGGMADDGTALAGGWHAACIAIRETGNRAG